jgi:hypothetical protein
MMHSYQIISVSDAAILRIFDPVDVFATAPQQLAQTGNTDTKVQNSS